jgi:hypothetical protein
MRARRGHRVACGFGLTLAWLLFASLAADAGAGTLSGRPGAGGVPGAGSSALRVDALSERLAAEPALVGDPSPLVLTRPCAPLAVPSADLREPVRRVLAEALPLRCEREIPFTLRVHMTLRLGNSDEDPEVSFSA